MDGMFFPNSMNSSQKVDNNFFDESMEISESDQEKSEPLLHRDQDRGDSPPSSKFSTLEYGYDDELVFFLKAHIKGN